MLPSVAWRHPFAFVMAAFAAMTVLVGVAHVPRSTPILIAASLVSIAALTRPGIRPDTADRRRLAPIHADRRATFACSAGLVRPASRARPGLLVAGDYVDGPYPATLEAAVCSGRQAARETLAALGTMRSHP